MNGHSRRSWQLGLTGGFGTLICAGLLLAAGAAGESRASPLLRWFGRPQPCDAPCAADDGALGGAWYWLRSPDEEKRAVARIYNRYCLRCHGVDGRGVWDMPGVPDFTNARWQASRDDAALTRIIVEGRGAVMPPFRGTLSLEEAWAVGRYLRTFMPGTEVSRPEVGTPKVATPVP